MGFNLTRCNFCGECMERCLHTDLNRETGAEEIRKLLRGEKAEITQDCVGCFMCNTVCPTGANPYDLILWRQEQEGIEITEAFKKLVYLQEDTNVFPNTVVQEGKAGMPTLSTCMFTDFIPRLFEGQLFQDLRIVSGGGYEGQLAYTHMGKRVPKEFLQKQTDYIASTGVKEVIFFHGDDYISFGVQAVDYEIDVPFKCIPVSQYLRDYLKANPDKIQKKLNKKVAVQLCCAQRYSPWEDGYIDEILDMIGCERVKRTYDHENHLCCQCTVAPRKGNDYANMFRNKNIEDAKQAGAEIMGFSCAICTWSLRDEAKSAGIEPYMLINLVREALGEELPVGGAALGDDRPMIKMGLSIIRKEIDDFDPSDL